MLDITYIPLKERIFKVPSSPDEFSKYAIEPIQAFEPEWVVYWYERGNYDGQGFAISKKGDKFYYDNLGHCSCYGPTRDIGGASFNSLEDIEKIAKNYEHADEVIAYVKDMLAQSK